MKNLVIGLVVATSFAGAASAGNLEPPVMDPVIVETDATGSVSGTAVVALLALAILAAAIAD